MNLGFSLLRAAARNFIMEGAVPVARASKAVESPINYRILSYGQAQQIARDNFSQMCIEETAKAEQRARTWSLGTESYNDLKFNEFFPRNDKL